MGSTGNTDPKKGWVVTVWHRLPQTECSLGQRLLPLATHKGHLRPARGRTNVLHPRPPKWLLAAPKDRYKPAFTCHSRLFEFKRMPLVLANAPAVFQRTMDRVLHGLIGVCCFVHIADIIIYSRDAEEHAHHFKFVMDRLRQAGLKVKLDECGIAHTEDNLLGYIIGTDGITSDPEKTRAIATMTAPTSVTEVRRFLGMTGYYRRTIPDFVKIAAPLIALTRKWVTWEWSTAEQTAFNVLK